VHVPAQLVRGRGRLRLRVRVRLRLRVRVLRLRSLASVPKGSYCRPR